MDPSRATDFSSLTHKFRATTDNHQAGGNKVSKRNRQPLSCAPCRVRKLKCDRGHPCEACVKRGDEAGCMYGKLPLARPSETGSTTGLPPSNRGRAQERLRHLEQLVMQMVDNPPGARPSREHGADSAADKDPTDESSSIAKEGHLQYGSSESRYVGSTHWSAILENLQELKSALSVSGDGGDHPSSTELDESDDTEPQETDNLFGSTSHLSVPQILAQALPPRLQVDRRLSAYFRSSYLVIPFVHSQQFQRQYEQFWRTPLETPPLWISILFSICSLSANMSELIGSEPSTPEDQPTPRMSFMNAACQCLRLGGFTRPKRFVCEALGLYAQCKYISTLDPARDVSFIFSIAVRLAYRSGYHRDPSHFPHISVFEGEMRRRAWAMCRQFDLMVSFQLGLPNQIPPNSWDTQDPRNLIDTDFDEDTKVLPPSRPENEATQMLYFIVKSRLMTTFGKVCAHALSFHAENNSQQIMDLDREVRATYATVPKVLHVKPMSQSFADPSYLTMVRTNCEFLYQKSLLVLHRKYMTTSTHPHSAQVCTDAAIAITRHMLDLHKEFKPGGQLSQDRWMMNSFTLNDFYLAGMVLCLSVSMWKKANPGMDITDAEDRMKEQYFMLKDSIEICDEMSATSNEAKRVANVLRVVLVGKGGGGGSGTTPAPGYFAAAIGSHSFLHAGAFVNPSTASMQYDFNLEPLTLQERERIQNTLSDSSWLPSGVATTIAQQNQRHEYAATTATETSTSTSDTPGGNFANLMPGLNNPVPLSQSSPFISFVPFSRAHGSHQPTPTGSTQQMPTNTQAAEGPGMNMHMAMDLGMDVDWPLLDQWMAFPNPADIVVPFSDGTMAMSAPMVFADQRAGAGGGDGRSSYPPLCDAPSPSTAASLRDSEWSTAPFPFPYLGGRKADPANTSADARAVSNEAREERVGSNGHGGHGSGGNTKGVGHAIGQLQQETVARRAQAQAQTGFPGY